jgi:hypothetical protein
MRLDELRLKISGSFDRRGLGMLPRVAGVSRMVHLDLDLVATRSYSTITSPDLSPSVPVTHFRQNAFARKPSLLRRASST